MQYLLNLCSNYSTCFILAFTIGKQVVVMMVVVVCMVVVEG